MFENIGRKIKVLAQVVFWVGVIGSCIAGIVVLAEMESPIGLLIIFGGSVSALISSWLAYGFGELIDNSQSIVNNTKCIINNTKAVVNTLGATNQPTEPQPNKPTQNKTVTKEDGTKTKEDLILEKWRDTGVITEEEYQKLIANR